MIESTFIKDKKLLIFIIFFIAVIIGFKCFGNMKLVSEVNDAIKGKNYGCKIIINTEKDMTYPYVYYAKDRECNNSVTNEKNAFQIVKYKINKNGLIYLTTTVKDREWFKDVYARLNKIKKHNKKCSKCIKIRDYNSDYYINKDDLNKLELLMQ